MNKDINQRHHHISMAKYIWCDFDNYRAQWQYHDRTTFRISLMDFVPYKNGDTASP